jgi:hypothetical protein
MSGSTNAPFGFRPLEMWDGSPWNGAYRHFVSETSNDALYIGDALYRVVSDAKKTCGRYMAVDQLATAAAGTVDGVDDQILGIMIGNEGQFASAGDLGAPEQLQSDTIYVPASQDPAWLLNVVVDNAVIYTIQGDEAMTSYTDIGKNTVTYAASGSTTTGLSGMVADISNVAADASDNLLLVGLLDVPGNLVTDTYALINVMINIGYFQPGGYDPILGTLGV